VSRPDHDFLVGLAVDEWRTRSQLEERRQKHQLQSVGIRDLAGMVRFLVAAVHVSIPGLSDLDRNVETTDGDFICDMAFLISFLVLSGKTSGLGKNVRFDRRSVSCAASARSVFGQIIKDYYN